MSIGEEIKYYRRKKGLTQKQLGDLCQMADSAIRRYENGHGNPTGKTLKRIADALGVTVAELQGYMVFESPEAFMAARKACLDKLANDPDAAGTKTSFGADGTIKNEYISSNRERINAALDRMTGEGQKRVVAYAEDIAGNPRYQRDHSDASADPQSVQLPETGSDAPESK